jgi:hypothetical protein
LTDGFWANNKDEELPNRNVEVIFLVSVEEVTDSVLKDVYPSDSESIRRSTINRVIDSIESADSDSIHEVSVRSFYYGSRYYKFTYITYHDVRLVGAPPSSIGKFGYETDNWVWPRHTGDFSLFRVYTAPDGSPATYDSANVPLQSKNHLSLSLDGVRDGNYTMILGYPGRTRRYLTAWGVKEIMESINQTRITVRGERLKILKEAMNSSDELRIKYASKYSKSSNYWKYSIGQNRGIHNLNVLDDKKEQEQAFMQWVVEDTARTKKYGKVITSIEKALDNRGPMLYNLLYLDETFFRAMEITDFAYEAYNLYTYLKDDKDDTQGFFMAVEELKREAFTGRNNGLTFDESILDTPVPPVGSIYRIELKIIADQGVSGEYRMTANLFY